MFFDKLSKESSDYIESLKASPTFNTARTIETSSDSKLNSISHKYSEVSLSNFDATDELNWAAF